MYLRVARNMCWKSIKLSALEFNTYSITLHGFRLNFSGWSLWNTGIQRFWLTRSQIWFTQIKTLDTFCIQMSLNFFKFNLPHVFMFTKWTELIQSHPKYRKLKTRGHVYLYLHHRRVYLYKIYVFKLYMIWGNVFLQIRNFSTVYGAVRSHNG